MEGTEPQQADEPPPNRKNLLRRVPVGGLDRSRPVGRRPHRQHGRRGHRQGASSATQASLGCPEGSEVIELRGGFENDDDLPEMAACVEPLP